MASSQNVEMEAAKFLHKLIQESKDEPGKLATKLYVVSLVLVSVLVVLLVVLFVIANVILFVFNNLWLFQILQHMKSSGKEHSMPYQVISRCIISYLTAYLFAFLSYIQDLF